MFDHNTCLCAVDGRSHRVPLSAIGTLVNLIDIAGSAISKDIPCLTATFWAMG